MMEDMKRKINNVDLAIWCCVQTLIDSKCEEGARILIQENNFSLEYQKRLQDEEGNTFQDAVENFWRLTYSHP